MKAIIAVNNLGYIGKENKLLWHCSEDLKHFKKMTEGKTMLVGYNTYQTLPKVVKDRDIHIDHRNKMFTHPQQNKIGFKKDIDIICIGGKKTYEKYQHLFTELHISRINNVDIGDCTFPKLTNLNPDCKIFNYYFEPNNIPNTNIK